MADGSIKIDVDVGIAQAEKQLEDLKNKAEQSGDSVSESMNIDIDNLDKQFQKASNTIEKTKNKISELEAKLSEIKSAKIELQFQEGVRSSSIQEQATLNRQLQEGSINQAQFNQLIKESVQDYEQAVLKSERLAQVISSLGDEDKLTSQLQNQNMILDNQVISYEIMGNRADRISSRLDNSAVSASSLNNETKKVSASMKEASKNAGNISNGISKGIMKLGKYALALFSIRTAYQTLRKLSNQWLQSDDAGARQVKANIDAMSNALSNALAPVITYIANLMATVFGYVNAILKAFFGIDLLAKKTSKNTGGVAGNTKKARKEAEKFSSAFDKADIATSKTKDNLDGAGGGGGGMDMPAPIIPTPDISGITKAFDLISKMFQDIWKTDTVQSFFDSFVRIGKNSFDLMAGISANVWDNLVLTFDEMLPHLIRGFASAVEFYRMMFEDIADATDKWTPTLLSSINSFVDGIFNTFRPLFVFLVQLWADMWGIFEDVWKKYGKDLVDSFFNFVNSTIKVFTELWAIIDTIISPILEIFKDVWDNTLKDVVQNVLEFLAELFLFAMELYNGFIAPIVGFLLNNLQPVFAVVFGTIGGIISGFLNIVFSIVDSVISIFKSLIQFLRSVFTGQWGSIWENLVNMVRSIFGAVVNVVKLPLNFMIDLLNGFIRGLNRIKIPTWVPGFGGMGININPIPRLAQGTYVTGGAMTAIVGEAGKEAVVPLQNNTEWIHDFLDLANANGGLGNGGGMGVVNVVLDGSVLATATVKEEKKRNILMNGVLA
ncbi:hypothetical protein [Pseudomonas sp.]|uniref:hypothetical protein n=1 Tax=Pseudomonas sp. TaxID=306 RepID=UPI00262CA45C|nr:hypothetical protein [Pseudomonas sp.]